MPNTPTELHYATDGRLIDYLEGILLIETPEEKIRQVYLQILHIEYGYPKNLMRREVSVYSGSKEVVDGQGSPIRADIIVYRSPAAAANKNQGQIKFVVECKRPDVTSGYNQLVSYIYNTSASGGVWTNGPDDVQAFRRLDAPSNALDPAPGIPRFNEEWDAVGRKRRDQLVHSNDVRRLLRLCHNKLHGIGIDADEEDLTMDMVRIILAKAQDELGVNPLPDFYCSPEEYRTTAGRQAVTDRVQNLFRTFADDNHGVFQEHEKIGVSPTAVTEVVSVLQGYAIMTQDDDADEWDIMGSAYEQYTATHLKRQRGQFFTNRRVVDLMVSALNPDSSVRALDPAGGSGGFITSVLRHVRRQIISSDATAVVNQRQLSNLRQHLFTVEVSPRLVKIAKTAMLLNGDGHAGMTRGNSLGPYDQFDPWILARCGRHKPTLILTNPPFAGTGEGQISDQETLARFDLGHRWISGPSGLERTEMLISDGCPPEMLFFERCLDWLAPGGQLGIVLPKSFLDTATYRVARHLLLSKARLLGVINCHKNTFQPHTGVRTCVLLIQKLHESEAPLPDYEIFMAISRKAGQDSEGRPVYKRDASGDATEEIDHDMTEILQAFRDFQAENLRPSEYRFVVSTSELDESSNINPQRYLPHLNESLRGVQALDGHDGWAVTSLSQVEVGTKIFKGPRLRTDNIIVDGPDDGPQVEPYYTPSAILQDKRDSVKWLDLSKATSRQLDAFDAVRVNTGDLLITRSGSIGRVAYITQRLDRAIVSDDAIRVRIQDAKLRAYVYAWLQSQAAQDQLMINEYGAVQQHLEPHHVADLLIPIPEDWSRVEEVVRAGSNFFWSKERADSAAESMSMELSAVIELSAAKLNQGDQIVD